MVTVGGVVLCGGQSKRMGRPKAWLPFAGEIMLPRVARLLSQAVQPIVVVAAQGQELPPLPADVRIVRDKENGRGPLQGLAAGIAALQDHVAAVYATGCDTPLLRPAFVQRMIHLLGDWQICVPRVVGHDHPLAAVYRVEVLGAIEILLKQDCLRLASLFDTVSTRFISAEELSDADPTFESLRNLNTPEDIAN